MQIEQKINQVLSKDSASKMLGIHLIKADDNGIEMGMQVTDSMTNGYDICHGGIIFSLADTALAFACVALGETALTQSAQIDYVSSAHLGDKLRAVGKVINRRKRNICCDIEVYNQQDTLIALVRGRQLVMAPLSGC